MNILLWSPLGLILIGALFVTEKNVQLSNFYVVTRSLPFSCGNYVMIQVYLFRIVYLL